MATLSTSSECGLYAGMSSVSVNSFPSESMIDLFREIQYNEIKSVLGSSITDIDGYAKTFELRHVKIDILNVLNNLNVDSKPSIQEKIDLANHFSLVLIESFEPDQDGSLSGSTGD